MRNNFRRDLYVSIAVIVGSFLIATFGLYILHGSLEAQVGRTQAVQSQIAQARTDAAAELQLEKQAPFADHYRERMDSLVPSYDELFNVREWIDTVARNHGVSAHFSFQGEPGQVTGDTIGEAAFGLTVTGSPSNIANFLQEVETLSLARYLTTFEAFDFTSNGERYQLSFQGKIYYRE